MKSDRALHSAAGDAIVSEEISIHFHSSAEKPSPSNPLGGQ